MRKLSMLARVLLVCCLPQTLGPSSLPAAQQELVCRSEPFDAVGEVVIGRGQTIEQAEVLACAEAERKALDTCPAEISAHTVVLNSEVLLDVIRSVRSGVAVRISNPVYETISRPEMRGEERVMVPHQLCRVRLRIVTQPGDPDLGFRVTLSGVEKSYNEGEELRVRVTASKDSYVYLFSVDADQAVTVFFPNKYRSENFLKPGQTIEFPDDNDLQRGLHLRMGFPQNWKSESSKEWITAIATKKPADLLTGTQIHEALNRVYTKKETALLSRLVERIAQLNSADVAQDVAGYTVYRKSAKKP